MIGSLQRFESLPMCVREESLDMRTFTSMKVLLAAYYRVGFLCVVVVVIFVVCCQKIGLEMQIQIHSRFDESLNGHFIAHSTVDAQSLTIFLFTSAPSKARLVTTHKKFKNDGKW